jgi:hypothetical protein
MLNIAIITLRKGISVMSIVGLFMPYHDTYSSVKKTMFSFGNKKKADLTYHREGRNTL